LSLHYRKGFPCDKGEVSIGIWENDLLQHDNARPHVNGDNPQIQTKARKDGWEIKMMNQSANSPDLNILDLGFFRSVQSIQQRLCAQDIDTLVSAVRRAFAEVSATSLLRNSIILKEVMKCVLDNKGRNCFKIYYSRRN